MADGAPNLQPKRRIDRKHLKNKKLELNYKIKNVSSSLKRYFLEVGKMKNMNNLLWSNLLNDERRLGKLHEALEADTALFCAKGLALERVLTPRVRETAAAPTVQEGVGSQGEPAAQAESSDTSQME